MKKILVVLLFLGLMMSLSAQHSQQIKPKKQMEQNKQKVVQKKVNYELEYQNLNEAYKKLQNREKETHMKWKRLSDKHNKYIQSYKTNQAEVDALKKANTSLQSRNRRLQNNFNSTSAENETLKKENARLEAELIKLKPQKKKVTKSVTKGN